MVWAISVRGKVAMICEVGVITPIRESNGGRNDPYLQNLKTTDVSTA